MIKGKNKNWRDNPFCEGIREGDWKYIRMFDGVEKYTEADIDFSNIDPDFEQLFNLKDDPEERINLIEKYKGSKFLDRLRQKCSIQSIELNKSRDEYKKELSIQTR